jgi:hypothetical protein
MKIRLRKIGVDNWVGTIGVYVLFSWANWMFWCFLYDGAKLIWHWIFS